MGLWINSDDPAFLPTLRAHLYRLRLRYISRLRRAHKAGNAEKEAEARRRINEVEVALDALPPKEAEQ